MRCLSCTLASIPTWTTSSSAIRYDINVVFRLQNLLKGQGDFHCGELMIRDMNRGSSRLRGVFMHEIRSSVELFRQVDLSTPTEHLHYFYHYGHAAKQVLDEGTY